MILYLTGIQYKSCVILFMDTNRKKKKSNWKAGIQCFLNVVEYNECKDYEATHILWYAW